MHGLIVGALSNSVIQVEYVEQDQVIDMYEYLSQENAPWGLSRISHTANGATNYAYDSTAGEGACVVSYMLLFHYHGQLLIHICLVYDRHRHQG